MFVSLQWYTHVHTCIHVYTCPEACEGVGSSFAQCTSHHFIADSWVKMSLSKHSDRKRLREKTTVLCYTEGASSGEDEEAEGHQSSRGACGQFVWPCPREYPDQIHSRRAKKWLIPADLSKEDFGVMFKKIVNRYNLGPNLVKVHVFDEPHKRYNPSTGKRERHKHLVFKMKTPFAHLQIQKALAAQGVYGHFSFNLVGYVAYLSYCLVPSAKKLQADIDRSPWSWPTVEPAALEELCAKASEQMKGRNGSGQGGRKRKLMTFSELTDAFVEASVRTEKDAWTLGKFRKEAGDDTMYNTLGSTPCVNSLVVKIRRAWDCQSMAGGTLCSESDFPLHMFVPLSQVNPALAEWVAGGWKNVCLILCGLGGLGKTELACALMMAVAPSGTYHFINKLDRLRDVLFCPGEGLVADEACLVDHDVDDIKGLLDLAKSRDVQCRNRDGHIPKGTPRIFSTNWSWDLFWPRDAWLPANAVAIQRRVLWVDIQSDLRAPAGGLSNQPGLFPR